MTMENIEIDSIIIKERLRVDNGDIDKLSENILENGLLEPIILNSHNELIDGFRRLSALKMLSERFVPASIVDVTDIDGMLKIEYDANEFRKEFTKSEKMSFLHKYKNDHGLKQGGNNNPNGRVGKESRVSNDTLDKYEKQKAKDSRKDENAKAAGFSNYSEARRVNTIMKKLYQR